MNNLNPSRKPAARTRSGNFLTLLLPAALILALLMLFLAGGATASAQVVTNSADSGPGTLRSALTNAASGAVIREVPADVLYSHGLVFSPDSQTLASASVDGTVKLFDLTAMPGPAVTARAAGPTRGAVDKASE